MRGTVLALRDTMPDAEWAVDLTGGADTRTVLAILLTSGSSERIRARNIMDYPHPDANVAGLLCDRYGLLPARSFVSARRGPVSGAFEAAAIEAFLHGGMRDGAGTINSALFLGDYVHFTGCFGGGLGGKTGRPPLSSADIDKRVEETISRRRRIGQFDFVSDAGVDLVRASMRSFYEHLTDVGVPPEHMEAESYLAGRCRSHFGLLSLFANKRRVTPDILCNRLIVDARRALAPTMYHANKVIFDLLLTSNSPDLVFAPMAEHKWDATIVPASYLRDLEEMRIITRSSAPLCAVSSLRLREVSTLPAAFRSSLVLESLDSSVHTASIVFPSDRARAANAALVDMLLTTGGSELVDEYFDVDRIRATIANVAWSPKNVVQAAFFEKFLPGLVWVLGLEARVPIVDWKFVASN